MWSRRAPCWTLPSSRSTPPQQRQQPRTLRWFGLLPVRSPLLRESSLFLGVLRCFSSPGSLRRLRGRSAVSSGGCPIRTPQDRRLPAPPLRVSPRGHVLHRPLAPRHPPCALLRLCLPTSSVCRISSSWCARGRLSSKPSATLAAQVAPLQFFKVPSTQIPAAVEPRGFEPRTSAVQRRRSPRLSYGPSPTPRRRRPPFPGWARLDSNQGPRPYQGRALTT